MNDCFRPTAIPVTPDGQKLFPEVSFVTVDGDDLATCVLAHLPRIGETIRIWVTRNYYSDTWEMYDVVEVVHNLPDHVNRDSVTVRVTRQTS